MSGTAPPVHPHAYLRHKGGHHAAAHLKPETVLVTVIRPTLLKVGLASTSAEMLLMGTAAQESNFRPVSQAGGGPAKGLFQMEPVTHDDLWRRVLHGKRHRGLADAIRLLINGAAPKAELMMTNAAYAAAMCRVKYYSVAHHPIPDSVADQAGYWKRWYNTPAGAGTREEYLHNWATYCATLFAGATVSAG